MSTFKGLVPEFPDIRIDFFRSHADKSPPLACFLSHVHSDHLAGLETLRSPFVYCSHATREILLRLERYQCRINYAKRILEARQQTYKHLSKVLKPLPLETPTVLELRPGHHIQATLFDSNHCPGSVMFLIEGNGKAILYSGDVRCEPWFVNSLKRNPNLIAYTHGIKPLDKLYLDTSFIKDIPFQTKAQGIAELLREVSRYPDDTIFYIQSWTYGYEDVWIALSKALNSPIHVDEYKYRIYNSLSARSSEKTFSNDIHFATIAASLTGYMCGNTSQSGCLTSATSVRLHSCESGNMCEIAKGKTVVRIQPVVARLPSGESMLEAGIGGGCHDLERQVELDSDSLDVLKTFLATTCASSGSMEEAENQLMKALLFAMSNGCNIPLNAGASDFKENLSEDLVKILASVLNKTTDAQKRQTGSERSRSITLSNIIRFPYSRHSSYPELCDLVDAFQPNDVWPCTVDLEKWLKNATTIKSLFGKYCSGDTFLHDLEMDALFQHRIDLHINSENSRAAETQASRSASPPISSGSPRHFPPPNLDSPTLHAAPNQMKPGHYSQDQESSDSEQDNEKGSRGCVRSRKRDYHSFQDSNGKMEDEGEGHGEEGEDESQSKSQRTDRSFDSALSERHSRERHEAYESMLRNAKGGVWKPIELISTDGNHHTKEVEL